MRLSLKSHICFKTKTNASNAANKISPHCQTGNANNKKKKFAKDLKVKRIATVAILIT